MFVTDPEEVIKQAARIAGVLADIINKQKLYTLIGNKKYVRVEGWQTLGALIGAHPREVEVHELKDGSYEAKVEIVNAAGRVIGAGSALCGIDESRWGSADRYARRSMAITRATGKAYRLGFAWIMVMAGYEATPAEEMPKEPEWSDDHRKALAEMLHECCIRKEEWKRFADLCKPHPAHHWHRIIKAEVQKGGVQE